jgi:drug/metabolite transporter (DMT)-like permease
MNTIKKYAGLLWIALGPLAMYFLIQTAAAEIHKKPITDTWVQWSIFIIVALPIAIGMIFFGLFALRGEYNQLPEDSADKNSGN